MAAHCQSPAARLSVLARLVAEVRAEAADRLYQILAGTVHVQRRSRLDGLLVVPTGARVWELDRLRRAPDSCVRAEMVRALERAAEVIGLGAGTVEVGEVPPGRMEALARHGLLANAAMLRRLPDAPPHCDPGRDSAGAAGGRSR